MEYRTLGESHLQVSAVTFGAWAIGGWMWGGTDMKAAVEAIHAALDEGISTIDTAPAYGYGLSEKIIGEALHGKSRDKVQILTKFGLRWDVDKGSVHMRSQDESGKTVEMRRLASKKSVIEECEQSLRRLGTDYIDLYQIHWPDLTTPIEETMEALIRLQEQGKVREGGVCNYSPAQMDEAASVISLASNQVPYSMLLRNIEDELVPYCLEHKKSIIAYSPMQRGVLTGKFEPGHSFKEGDHRADQRYFTPENISRVNAFLDKIRPIAEVHQATLAQLVLRWTVMQPGITVALAGARNPKQAIENAGAMRIDLSQEELTQINDALSSLQLEA
jgi:aryl-alcohol dehydrogenase-like predicted oxidoreductase